MSLTLGSLFSGSGGFEFGGKLAGITPLWASEIEPFPIAVTRKNLPEVRHLGDVRDINGADVTPVDVLTFGSCCQDLSNSGKKAGLDGSRSCLFFEAIRIIKEMRAATNGKYPRYAVFENVKGLFWVGQGEDFRRVLEQFCSVVGYKDKKNIPPKPDRWRSAGCIMADDFSLAWRLFDASGWGVPQRRERVYLVADFTGQSAPQILFESEGLRWNISESRKPWEDYPRSSEESTGETSSRFNLNNSLVLENHPQDSRIKIKTDGLCQTLTTNMGTGGNNVPLVGVPVNSIYDIRLTTTGTKNARANIYQTDTSRTLEARMQDPNSNYGGVAVVYDNLVVRRLTPLECSRLQGFPDGWCDNLGILDLTDEDMDFWRKVFTKYAEITGKRPKTENQIRKWLMNPYNEAAEYRMWGNGVALPNVYYIMSGIVLHHND